MAARYLVGIDLGTTNTAVAYVDTRAGSELTMFEVPQLVAPGEVAERRQLPSFVYLAGEELGERELALPWAPAGARLGDRRVVVGELARSQGARNATRMISSAKSWLCHPGVDRTADILPWGDSAAGGPRSSPVAASSAVLSHVRAAWDHAHPGAPLAEQEVILTVPASFDESARELTLAAAAAAGLPPVVLLEEPQAAFYAWLDERRRGQAVHEDERVLVFDVGGGTTDFTLIEVARDAMTRTAVGDHLLLGGDNVDLTLAKLVESRLATGSARKLDALQWHALVHACRLAKEALLDDADPSREAAPIVVQSRGAKLIAGTLRDEIRRDELARVLLEGFFPLVEPGAQPARGRGGLHEFGLPYAADPAITRHLSAFLSRHATHDGKAQKIDAILFNGGAMTPAALRQRVLDQLAAWQGEPPRELTSRTPELAVARGAAYYGLVRRGEAAAIGGGSARAYYVGAAGDSSPLAVCLAAKGLAEGSRSELAHDFELMTNRPVSFRFFSSSSRDDAVGALVPIGDGRAETLEDGSDLLELAPIVTVLRARGRGKVTVRVETLLTELGRLELWCVEQGPGGERWKLQLDLRRGGAAPTEAAEAEAAPGLEEAKAVLPTAFAPGGAALAQLPRDLETALGARRDDWSLATARALFDTLIELAPARKHSAEHEQRWLHWLGFLLRPGSGAQLDAWRTRRMWGVFNEGLVHGKSEPARLAWWITWRRISGGLAKGQQEQLYDRLAPLLLPNARQAKKVAETKPSKQEFGEMWRTIGSLELLPVASKAKLGDELAARLATRKGREEPAHLWALARLGGRTPLYGPLNAVVSPRRVAEWVPALCTTDWPEPDKVAFALAQLGRKTGDRSRDLDDATRALLLAAVRALPGGERAAVLLEQVVELEAREERVAMGDTLPAGLRLAAARAPSEEPPREEAAASEP